MRQDYYDRLPPKPGPGAEGPDRPVPFGDVPPQRGGGVIPRKDDPAEALPSVSQTGATPFPQTGATPFPQTGATPFPQTGGAPLPKAGAAPAFRAGQTPDLRRTGRGWKFALLLLLILALAAAGTVLRGGLSLPQFSVTGNVWSTLTPGFDPWGGDYDDYDDYDYDGYGGQWEWNWRAELENITAPRAPLGDGTTLELLTPPAEALDPKEIYRQVIPSVVSLRVVRDDWMAGGTGIIISSDGYIVTNAHLMGGATELSVVFSDGTEEEALLVGWDAANDLAVLKIHRTGLTAATFGNSDDLQVGDTVYAIGIPIGDELWGTMTDGIVSGLDRTVDLSGREITLLQTSAHLNPGSSGGALVDRAGRVVGITNMKIMSQFETVEGLGFAIPSAQVKESVDQIIATGSYAGRPMLGIRAETVPAADGSPAGVYVVSAEESSDAYVKGLREGCIITGANGKQVSSLQDLEDAKADLKVGDSMELTVWDGRTFRRVRVLLVGEEQL